MTGKLAALAILAAALHAQTVSVSGRITDASSGVPIEGASVIIFAGDFQAPQSTDSAGNYRIDGVPPNAAVFRVQAKGFLDASPTTIHVSPDSAVQNFALTPVSSIVGRIRTEDGGLIPGYFTVVLYREDYTDGVRHWAAGARLGDPSDGISSLGDDGSFKITNLAAGRYILSAGPPTGEATTFILSRISGKLLDPLSPSEGYIQTYYPGTTDLNAAIPIELHQGETVTADLNIAKHRLYKISGELAPGPGPSRGSVQVSSLGDGVTHHSYSGAASDSGVFFVENLPPGDYLLKSIARSIARPGGSGATISMATLPLNLPFTISDHDIDLLHPTPVPRVVLPPVEGTFKTASGKALPANLAVLFAFPQPGGQTDSIPAAPGGEFWLDGTPGDYSLRPVVPPTYAVSEIRYSGGNYLNSLIPFSADAIDQKLTILLTDQPASVSGSLVDDQQKPIAAKVILAPDPLPPNFDFHALRVATTNNDGSFSLTGLTPGRYKAAVLTGEDRKRDRDLAILNDKFAAADAFELTAGQNLTIAPKP